jgi:hypothetical protein
VWRVRTGVHEFGDDLELSRNSAGAHEQDDVWMVVGTTRSHSFDLIAINYLHNAPGMVPAVKGGGVPHDFDFLTEGGELLAVEILNDGDLDGDLLLEACALPHGTEAARAQLGRKFNLIVVDFRAMKELLACGGGGAARLKPRRLLGSHFGLGR